MARTRAQSLRNVAQSVAGGADPRAAARDELLRRTGAGGGQPSGDSGEDERFETGEGMDPADFPAAREQDGSSVDTVMRQKTVSLDEAGEALSRSEQLREGGGTVHAIYPMVSPRAGRCCPCCRCCRCW
ncbi:hypothetical protein PV661_32875 [Streptomyces sp. MD20-1-1]|nr:hypothetical protein [Streptomyces sp. MD20-1-1]